MCKKQLNLNIELFSISDLKMKRIILSSTHSGRCHIRSTYVTYIWVMTFINTDHFYQPLWHPVFEHIKGDFSAYKQIC